MASMTRRIMIAGAIARHPLGGGGNTWAFLQYVLGFRRLGFDTYYIEHLAPEDCVDDEWRPTSFVASANARYFQTVIDRFDLGGHAGLFERDGGHHIGLSREAIEKLAPEVELLVNLSGHFHLESVLRAVRRRLFIDLDPGFTQIWQEHYGVDMNLRGHDTYLTVGLHLGEPDCPLPTCGIDWQTTLPPVVCSAWATDSPAGVAYSTVADWRGYSPVEWNGVWYGQKAEEFMRLIELPERVSVPLEICLAIHPEEPDLATLQRHRWRLVSPREHTATPDAYLEYIQASRGEFTVVKNGYAAGRTGWFSDRSACYLAAGRPVIIQDTGVGLHVPTGSGLLTFRDLDDAVAAIEDVESSYARHAAAASAFAREYLDSDRVLTRLWEIALGSTSGARPA
jgi:hypothetical protein